jgi:hypothetical protein
MASMIVPWWLALTLGGAQADRISAAPPLAGPRDLPDLQSPRGRGPREPPTLRCTLAHPRCKASKSSRSAAGFGDALTLRWLEDGAPALREGGERFGQGQCLPADPARRRPRSGRGSGGEWYSGLMSMVCISSRMSFWGGMIWVSSRFREASRLGFWIDVLSEKGTRG